jgi:cell fate (sporulation/competence/biofilm development) regulator YmcA (YheA/YmcA/DUF963 family)
MKKLILYLLFSLAIINLVVAQNTKGIHFQGIARSENGIILANKQITLRISILNDTTQSDIEYQEIKSVTTNVLGLFYTNIGVAETGKIMTAGSFEAIQWQQENKYLLIEVDPNNSLHFLQAGFEKINYVPYSLYAQQAKTLTSILPIDLGGTGVNNTNELLLKLHLEKINNTPDSLKPISNPVMVILNEKLKKLDTITLSNRINLKLNAIDTLKLSSRINLKLNSVDTLILSNRINGKLNSMDTIGFYNRINTKLNSADTINLSNRINQISSNQSNNYYGFFYDTAKQIALQSTATAVKFNFQQLTNKININNNSSGNPTKITIVAAGIYIVNYHLQFIKSDAGTDEIIVWLRKNNAAIANTNNTYSIQGLGIKNNMSNNFLLELAANDYIELFFSVKNVNSILQGTVSSTVTPSRPATPSASISLYSVQ